MKTNILIGIAGFLLSACSNETELESVSTNPDMPISGTASITEMTRADKVIPPVGKYWLYYTQKGSNKTPLECEVKTDKDSLYFKESVTPVWGWVQNASPLTNTTFHLTNVGNGILPTISDNNYDVLWGETKGWGVPLNFILTHRMSMLTIKLTTSDISGQSVDFSKMGSCKLDNIATAIQDFNINTGIVKVVDNKNQTISFTRKTGETGTDVYTTAPVILPPQKRNELSKVSITIDGKTFTSTLPEGMTLVTDQYSRLFEFLQGYHLTITAKLFSDGASDRIMFTAATLTPWIYDGSGTIGAKVGGIYDETDLTNWITAYNTAYTNKISNTYFKKADSISLLKYGKWDNKTKMWIFSLYKEIPQSSIRTKITAFNDSIYSNGYKIKSITTESELFDKVNLVKDNENGYGSVRIDSRIYDTVTP